MRLASHDLSVTLYSSMEVRVIRSADEVWQALSTPMRQRRQFITTLASDNSYYTVQEWHDWYAVRPLSETHMDEAVYQWKQEFPMNDHTREKIEALEVQNTRQSKHKA